MDEKLKTFILEVKERYTDYPAYLDDKYNFVVSKDGHLILISIDILRKYYEGSIASIEPRNVFITRTIGYIRKVVSKIN